MDHKTALALMTLAFLAAGCAGLGTSQKSDPRDRPVITSPGDPPAEYRPFMEREGPPIRPAPPRDIMLAPRDEDTWMGVSAPPLSKRDIPSETKKICVGGRRALAVRDGFNSGFLWDDNKKTGKPQTCGPKPKKKTKK